MSFCLYLFWLLHLSIQALTLFVFLLVSEATLSCRVVVFVLSLCRESKKMSRAQLQLIVPRPATDEAGLLRSRVGLQGPTVWLQGIALQLQSRVGMKPFFCKYFETFFILQKAKFRLFLSYSFKNEDKVLRRFFVKIRKLLGRNSSCKTWISCHSQQGPTIKKG